MAGAAFVPLVLLLALAGVHAQPEDSSLLVQVSAAQPGEAPVLAREEAQVDMPKLRQEKDAADAQPHPVNPKREGPVLEMAIAMRNLHETFYRGTPFSSMFGTEAQDLASQLHGAAATASEKVAGWGKPYYNGPFPFHDPASVKGFLTLLYWKSMSQDSSVFEVTTDVLDAFNGLAPVDRNAVVREIQEGELRRAPFARDIVEAPWKTAGPTTSIKLQFYGLRSDESRAVSELKSSEEQRSAAYTEGLAEMGKICRSELRQLLSSSTSATNSLDSAFTAIAASQSPGAAPTLGRGELFKTIHLLLTVKTPEKRCSATELLRSIFHANELTLDKESFTSRFDDSSTPQVTEAVPAN